MNDPSAGRHAQASGRVHPGRAIVVSSVCTEAEFADRLGREAYSYRFVYRAFAPLLERWGRTIEITRPESRLDYAIEYERQQGCEPVHLSFLPLQLSYLSAQVPNIGYPFWEFPDIPRGAPGDNPRHDWVRVAEKLALLLTASEFTRDAFLRAGVRTPVHVVPVPINPAYFRAPPWTSGQRYVLDCPAYIFPLPGVTQSAEPSPWRRPAAPAGIKACAKRIYKDVVRPRLPGRFDQILSLAARAVSTVREGRRREETVSYPVTARLELSGVVWTMILNPFCPRKNWEDLLSAFLLALSDCDDATLVIKLIVCPKLAPLALNGMIAHYLGLGLKHRCKLAFVPAYLSDQQMLNLAAASTFYVNTARAEGACLPLQDFLAAGRPGLAPVHTALADYFHDEIGLVIASHPEPAAWPHDRQRRCTTFWHRLVWQSLHDQLRASYLLAKEEQGRYQEMAARGRQEMANFAGAEQVWPRLRAALDTVVGVPGALRKAS
jgi:glycosyltransferase involved in cell wall biosynthesis